MAFHTLSLVEVLALALGRGVTLLGACLPGGIRLHRQPDHRIAAQLLVLVRLDACGAGVSRGHSMLGAFQRQAMCRAFDIETNAW